MNFKTLMTKEFKLPSPPPFHTYRKALYLAIIFLLAPNVVFWLFTWYLGLARPLINLDYLWVSALMVAPLPYGLNKPLATIIFFGLAIIDSLMLVMQLFPFMDIGAMLYLAPFIWEGPKSYLILTFLAMITLVISFIALIKYSQKQQAKIVFSIAIVIGLFGYNFDDIKYKDAPSEFFGFSNFYIFHSQVEAYERHNGSIFSAAARNIPNIVAGPKDYASKFFKQPYSDKLMLVVVESWGVAREKNVQRDILKTLYDQIDRFEFIEENFFYFADSTVNGELRELCQLNIANSGYALQKVDDSVFKDCLPNQLKKMGYKTIGMHGSSGLLYDRLYWYPKAGLDKSIFAEHVPEVARCHAFNGACDNDLMEVIAKEFKQNQKNKLFFYWLTLTNHFPYDQDDLQNSRLDCEKNQLFAGDICHNFRLHAQFFDGLGELLKRPEMAGVEVIVVGDHMPPITTYDVPIHHNIRWTGVSWIHFKVKDTTANP